MFLFALSWAVYLPVARAAEGTVYTINPSATFERLDPTTLAPLSRFSAGTSSGPAIVSSDGATFYTKGPHEVTAVDRRTGNVLQHYELKYTGTGSGLAVTPDRKVLFAATCDFDPYLGCGFNFMEVFSVATGQRILALPFLFQAISTITPTPDSSGVYVTHYYAPYPEEDNKGYYGRIVSGAITLFSVATLQPLANAFEPDGFTSFFISPDGSKAYATSTANIYVLSLAPLSLIQTIPIPPYPLGTISALSQNGATLALFCTLANYYSVFYFLDTATLTLSPPLYPERVVPRSIEVSPDGATAYATDDYQNIYNIDVASDTISIQTDLIDVADAVVAPDGSLYAELASGMSVEVLPAGSRTPSNLLLSNSYVFWLSVAPAGDVLYEASYRGGIDRISLDTGLEQTVTSTFPMAVVPSSDGNTLYAIDESTGFNIVDAQSGALLGAFALPFAGSGPGVAGAALAVNPVGGRVLAMDYGPAVVIDPQSQQILTTFQETGGTGLAIDPTGATAYVSNPGYQNPAKTAAIAVVNLATNRIIGSIPIPANCIIFSPDGARAYAFSYEGEVFGVAVIDTATLSVSGFVPIPYASSSSGGPQALAVTPDGSLLYVASPGDPYPGSIVDTQTLQVIGVFQATNVVTAH